MNWIEDRLGWILFVACAAIVVGIVMAVTADVQARDEFMRQCVKDRKEYECVAMWRQGQSRLVPMPIVIPMGR